MGDETMTSLNRAYFIIGCLMQWLIFKKRVIQIGLHAFYLLTKFRRRYLKFKGIK